MKKNSGDAATRTRGLDTPMNTNDQRAKAIAFRSLHSAPRILVMPNAWDASSACIFERTGFSAIATTSGGIAALFGYPDGQHISCQQMLQIVGRIAASVSVPVTADMEAGYGKSPQEVAETVRKALDAGVVGLNLEDGTGHGKPLADIAYQVEVIKAARAVAASANIPLVLNARTDVYLHPDGDGATLFKQAVHRATAYLNAGADCIYPIGLKDRATIAGLVREIRAPMNIMAGPNAPSIAELEEIGVARVTFGTALMRAVLPLVRRMAQELFQSGASAALAQTEFTHAEVNHLFER